MIPEVRDSSLPLLEEVGVHSWQALKPLGAAHWEPPEAPGASCPPAPSRPAPGAQLCPGREYKLSAPSPTHACSSLPQPPHKDPRTSLRSSVTLCPAPWGAPGRGRPTAGSKAEAGASLPSWEQAGCSPPGHTLAGTHGEGVPQQGRDCLGPVITCPGGVGRSPRGPQVGLGSLTWS